MDYLQKLFYPQTIPMDEDCWPLNGNTCVVNANSDHNFWPHGSNKYLNGKKYEPLDWNYFTNKHCFVKNEISKPCLP